MSGYFFQISPLFPGLIMLYRSTAPRLRSPGMSETELYVDIAMAYFFILVLFVLALLVLVPRFLTS